MHKYFITHRAITVESHPGCYAAAIQTEVRNFLQTVYQVGVERVHTINYEGKKKRRGNYFYQRADYKKVYVQLKEKWFPPKGFAVSAVDEKGHKPKRSPVKSGAKSYWLTNDDSE